MKIIFILQDVSELQGKWFGHMFGGPSADPVEEWRKAEPSAQSGTF